MTKRCVDCGATSANYTPIIHSEECGTDAAKIQQLEAENKQQKERIQKLELLLTTPEKKTDGKA